MEVCSSMTDVGGEEEIRTLARRKPATAFRGEYKTVFCPYALIAAYIVAIKSPILEAFYCLVRFGFYITLLD